MNELQTQIVEPRRCAEPSCGRHLRSDSEFEFCVHHRWIVNRPSEKKTCSHCGTEFHPQRSHQLYCSKQCKERAGWARRHPKNSRRCQSCEIEFVAQRSNQRYCSKRCRGNAWYRDNAERLNEEARVPQKAKVCAHCGADFTPRRSNARFCSKNCQQLAWYRAHHRARIFPVKFCDECGNGFRPKHTTRKRFCSQKCAARNWRVRQPKMPAVLLRCLLCEKEFTRHRSFQKYCSTACARRAKYLRIQSELLARLERADRVLAGGSRTKQVGPRIVAEVESQIPLARQLLKASKACALPIKSDRFRKVMREKFSDLEIDAFTGSLWHKEGLGPARAELSLAMRLVCANHKPPDEISLEAIRFHWKDQKSVERSRP